MGDQQDIRDANRLMEDGWSDEDVERLTKLAALDILALRALLATAPIRARPLYRQRPEAGDMR